jgi:cytochrome c55X
MSSRSLAALCAASSGVALLLSTSAFADPPAIDAGRKKELVRLVRQDCGSCHGLRLKGGLGPSLLPEALRDKPEESLRYTILLGRPGTAMPPWQTMLSEAEIDWILAQLLAGFPEEQRR